MLTPEQLLIYVGMPFAAILFMIFIFALVYLTNPRGAKRYRPGRPYRYAPVWFLARPETAGPTSAKAQIAAAGGAVSHPGPTGGASDRW